VTSATELIQSKCGGLVKEHQCQETIGETLEFSVLSSKYVGDDVASSVDVNDDAYSSWDVIKIVKHHAVQYNLEKLTWRTGVREPPRRSSPGCMCWVVVGPSRRWCVHHSWWRQQGTWAHPTASHHTRPSRYSEYSRISEQTIQQIEDLFCCLFTVAEWLTHLAAKLEVMVLGPSFCVISEILF